MPHTDLGYPIKDFIEYLSFQKRYSQNTILSYQNDLSAFFEYIKKEFQTASISEISTTMIRSWLASLKEKTCSSKTVNRKISALKSFFKFQLKSGIISINPVAPVASLKVSRKLPSFIEEREMETLWESGFFPDSFAGRTERLIFEILYQTGIRRTELIQLKESDVQKASGVIKVLGKGNKERFVPVSNGLLQLIGQYIDEKKATFPQGASELLLVNAKGGRLYPKYVYKVVKKNLNKVSNAAKKSPHVLRHTFATHLTNHGAEINAIKELLGHSSLASTQIYAHNSIERLKEVYKQAHPKAEK